MAGPVIEAIKARLGQSSEAPISDAALEQMVSNLPVIQGLQNKIKELQAIVSDQKSKITSQDSLISTLRAAVDRNTQLSNRVSLQTVDAKNTLDGLSLRQRNDVTSLYGAINYQASRINDLSSQVASVASKIGTALAPGTFMLAAERGNFLTQAQSSNFLQLGNFSSRFLQELNADTFAARVHNVVGAGINTPGSAIRNAFDIIFNANWGSRFSTDWRTQFTQHSGPIRDLVNGLWDLDSKLPIIGNLKGRVDGMVAKIQNAIDDTMLGKLTSSADDIVNKMKDYVADLRDNKGYSASSGGSLFEPSVQVSATGALRYYAALVAEAGKEAAHGHKENSAYFMDLSRTIMAQHLLPGFTKLPDVLMGSDGLGGIAGNLRDTGGMLRGIKNII